MNLYKVKAITGAGDRMVMLVAAPDAEEAGIAARTRIYLENNAWDIDSVDKVHNSFTTVEVPRVIFAEVFYS